MMAEQWVKLAHSLGYPTEAAMWEDLYISQGLSIPQLAERLDYGTHTIRRRLIVNKIERRPAGGPRVMTYQRERLFRMDQRALWTIPTIEVAHIMDISTAVVYKYLKLVKGDQDGLLCDQSNTGTGTLRDAEQAAPGVGSDS